MFKLMLVTDRGRTAGPLTEAVRLALEGGADAVQLRERGLSDHELHELAEQTRMITAYARAKLIINQRPDVALAVGADGVHLGWRSLNARDVRKLIGKGCLIGVSCHDALQLRSAEEAGADYALLGPVFRTPSKVGLVEAIGPDRLKEMAAAAKIPIIAIGGITADNAAQVLQAGVAGVAVISAILAAADPRAAAQALREAGY
jgi:thiamine-phosphate pyrophosphorylase